MAASKTKKVRANRSTESKGKSGGMPKCVVIADAGVTTGGKFASMMSALIGDIATGRIDTRSANAMCNAGGKLLKVVELQHRYGTPTSKSTGPKDLVLIPA